MHKVTNILSMPDAKRIDRRKLLDLRHNAPDLGRLVTFGITQGGRRGIRSSSAVRTSFSDLFAGDLPATLRTL
jgi:hypothetical protein